MELVMVVYFSPTHFAAHLEFVSHIFETSVPDPEKVLSNIY